MALVQDVVTRKEYIKMQLHKICNYVQAISVVIAAILLMVLAVGVLFQVVSREILKISVTWVEEIVKFSFMWSAMLGASILVRKQRHFSVNILSGVKSERFHNAIAVLGHVSVLFVSFCLFFYGLKFAQMGMVKFSPVLQIRMVWVYCAIPGAAILMMLYAIELLLIDFALIPNYSSEEMEKVSLSKLISKGKGGTE